MAIPKSDTVMLPLLRLAAGGEFRNADAIESLASEFRLTPEDRTQVLGNGQSKFANLVYWASGQLKTAKLLNKSLGGEYEITERGRTVLANPPEVIDRRFLAQFPEYRQLNGEKVTVQSESGEIEVEVPDRQEVLAPAVAESDQDIRQSIRMQARVAELGAILGFSIWIPPGDRSRVSDAFPRDERERFVRALPVNFSTATIKTIENIDVIWLDRHSVAHAFEIEHTTSIYSGLLRMADLLALQPRLQISLHIVAPTSRREQVRREIVRPVFSYLEGGAMAQRCSFISYDALESILRQPNLQHTRETILREYEEYFAEPQV
jgi:Mrr N-terminal domain